MMWIKKETWSEDSEQRTVPIRMREYYGWYDRRVVVFEKRPSGAFIGTTYDPSTRPGIRRWLRYVFMRAKRLWILFRTRKAVR